MRLIKIKEHPQWMANASIWFSGKWGVPKEAYLKSMKEKGQGIPQWYLAVDTEDTIVGGVGIIENDFHERKDLTPNVCALYVEPEFRTQGIAGKLLDICRQEAGRMGFSNLYLITDHTTFYEKYGWQYLFMVNCDGDEKQRMYQIAVG